MSKQILLQTKLKQEIANFHKTMEELNTLKRVSSDLRKYKKMIKIRKFD